MVECTICFAKLNHIARLDVTAFNKVRIRSLVDEITSDRKYYEAEGGAFSGNE